MEREVTPAQVADIGRAQRLKPTEQDFKGKPGYWRKYRPDGSYDWGYRFRPNDGHGNLTPEGAAVQEMMRPFQVADTERHAALQGRTDRIAVKDGDGRVQYLEPQVAENAVHRAGWRHHWRAGGIRVERGPDGMLWRWFGGGWTPTGRHCLGTPFRGSPFVTRRGIQRDPYGDPWRFAAGAWRRI
jgi:hypothetical protein